MIQIVCHSNLDLKICEVWPTELPTVPRIGERIRSGFSSPKGRFLELEVINVTWCSAIQEKYSLDLDESYKLTIWYARVELHIPRHLGFSINDFHKFYKEL